MYGWPHREIACCSCPPRASRSSWTVKSSSCSASGTSRRCRRRRPRGREATARPGSTSSRPRSSGAPAACRSRGSDRPATTDCHVPSKSRPSLDGQRERRGHEHGQEVVAAVADRPVTMGVAIVSRQQPTQRLLQVPLRTAPRLHQRRGPPSRGAGTRGAARRRLRVRGERPDALGQIHDAAAARVDVELDRLHRADATQRTAVAPAVVTGRSGSAFVSRVMM